jgi:hypothetical protein
METVNPSTGADDIYVARSMKVQTGLKARSPTLPLPPPRRF